MPDHPFRFALIALFLLAMAPTASAVGLDLFTPDGRRIPIAGAEIRVLADGEPLVTVRPARAAAEPGEVWHAGPVAPGTPAEGEGADAGPVEPVAVDAENAADARGERNAANVARLMPWIGAIAGLTVLAMVCAAIGSAWSHRGGRATKPAAKAG